MIPPNTDKREEALRLIKKKDEIDNLILELGNVLADNNNIGMTESLVDESGFPRNDIDVYQVRHARHQIICLQNDLKSVMNQIEKTIHCVHAEYKSNPGTRKLNSVDSLEGEMRSNQLATTAPFAKINLVSSTSPADIAGIRENDEIIEFGTINASNFKNLTQIGELVKHRQNYEIRLQIQRNSRVQVLTLIPKTWSGRGLLGCNIILMDAIER